MTNDIVQYDYDYDYDMRIDSQSLSLSLINGLVSLGCWIFEYQYYLGGFELN